MWRGWGWKEEDRVGCREKQRQEKERENDAHRDQWMPKPPGLLHWASRLQSPMWPFISLLLTYNDPQRKRTTGLE